MNAQYLGHVVFYVKSLDRSLSFYRDLLGFKKVGRVFNGTASALTSGRTHHESLLIQVGDAPGRRRDLVEGFIISALRWETARMNSEAPSRSLNRPAYQSTA